MATPYLHELILLQFLHTLYVGVVALLFRGTSKFVRVTYLSSYNLYNMMFIYIILCITSLKRVSAFTRRFVPARYAQGILITIVVFWTVKPYYFP